MKLKNWFTEKHNNHVVLYGTVYDDKTGNFDEGSSIRTSYIKDVTDVDGEIIVTTVNNTYKLMNSDYQEAKITCSEDGKKKYEFLWK